MMRPFAHGAGRRVRCAVMLTAILANVLAVSPTAVSASQTQSRTTPGVDPATVELTLAPGETASVEPAVTTPAIPPKPDIVLLADTTESMEPVLTSVRDNVSTIIETVRQAQPDAEFAVAEYKDESDGPKVFRVNLPLTADYSAVHAGTNQWLNHVGGGGAPWTDFINAHHRIATDAIRFRPGSTRIVAWFGGAPSNDPSLGHTLGDTTSALQGAGVRVVAVPVSGTSGGGLDTLGQATAITNATGGVLMPDRPAAEVAQAILDALHNLDVTVTPEVTTCDPELAVTFDADSRTVHAGDVASFTETIAVAADARAGSSSCDVDFLVDGVSQGFVQTIAVDVPARAPLNDDRANAQVLDGELPISVTGTNVDATKEDGEPSHAGNGGGASVWYRWQAQQPGAVTIETCGSDFDTLLAIYRLDDGDLVEVASNDDDCSLQSRLIIPVESGVEYYVAVDGFSGQTGSIALTLGAADPPTNDDFVDAEVVNGPLPITASASTFGATTEPGEPDHARAGDGPSASVWYRWTPLTGGPVTVDTCGSNFDTRLGIYLGTTVNNLGEVASNDDSCGTGSRVTFDASVDETYQIAISGAPGAMGSVVLRLTPRVPAPSNDDFANAEPLDTALPTTTTGRNTGASKEAGEPDHAGDRGGSSVWYRWTAPANGDVLIDTCGSSYDTLLAVYTGASVEDLHEVASNDDYAGCGTRSRIRFTAAAGTTYLIAVDGFLSFNGISSGSIALTVREPTPPPPNDNLADAQLLSGALPIAVSGTNVEATKEPGEPAHAGAPGGASVWYRWTPDADAMVTVDTCGSSFNTVLAVYTGQGYSDLSAVVANDDGGCGTWSRVTFPAAAGETYLLAVDRRGSATDALELAISAANRPANDDFADAETMSGTLPSTAFGTNVEATREPGEPLHAGNAGGASIWYRWTAAADGPVNLATCWRAGNTNFDTALGVYTGDALAALVEVAGDHDSAWCGDGQRQVTFTATAGTTYSIAVDGYNGVQGAIVRLRISAPPPNDDFADAEVIGGTLPITVTGTTADATKESGEPNHADGGANSAASIWYRWTPTDTGAVTISTCGRGGPVLGVYRGESVAALSEVASNFGACVLGAKVTFEATAGETYHLAISSQPLATGEVGLTIREPSPPPPNDDFAAAQELASALPQSVAGSNVNATEQAGEPDHAGNPGGASVWYRWTPETTRPVSIDVSSRFTLGVYTGTEVGAVTEVANADCSDGCLPARFTAEAGVSYLIAVDGTTIAGFLEYGGFQLSMRSLRLPPNDDFADAHGLDGTLPITVTGNNVDATVEPGEPRIVFYDEGFASVWYRWTAEASGDVSIDTCASSFDTLLGVFTGSALDDLSMVVSDDDTCAPGSSVTIAAVAGESYWIAVDGFGGLSGIINLTIGEPASRPANDDFAQAEVLDGPLPITTTGTNVGATAEDREPLHDGGYGTSVWYRWTAPSDGPVVINTCASDFDTVLAVYTGTTLSAGSQIASSNDACGEEGAGSRAVVYGRAGVTYNIAVAGYARGSGLPGARGEIGLTVRSANPPPNDHLANARTLDGPLPITVTGTNVDASRQHTGFPSLSGAEPGYGIDGEASASVWYSWRAATSGPVTFETCTSDLDTIIQVLVDRSDGKLGAVRNDNDGCGAPGAGSIATFDATAGNIYRIKVDGITGATGNFNLTLRSANTPANDDFANATVVEGPLPLAVDGTNVEATREPGEPGHVRGTVTGPSVWYRWTPAETTSVVIDTCDADFDTGVGVYVGTTLGGLAEIAADSGGCAPGSAVAFEAVAGTTYHVAVAGLRAGSFTLRWHVANPPHNDDVVDAELLEGPLPISVPGSTVDATHEPGEPWDIRFADSGPVWYRWTASDSGVVTIDTCTTGFDTILAVYSGIELGELARLGYDTRGCGRGSLVELPVTAGTTYWIAVGGSNGAGNFTLTVREPNRPPNDDFVNAKTLAGSLPVTTLGTTREATQEDLEPFHGGRGVSVWYRWTAAADGPVTINTCASDFDTVLAIYTGETVDVLQPVAAANDGCGTAHGGSRVSFAATAGTTYRIAVDFDWWLGATTESFELSLAGATTTTTVTTAPNPSSYGEDVRVTATVVSDGGPTPTGTIQFLIDGVALGTPQALVEGRAAVTTSTLAVGEHTVTARYSGDEANDASDGSATLTVERGESRLVSDPAVLRVSGLQLTLRLAAALSDAAGNPLAGKTVQFVVAGNIVCSSTTNVSGRATCGYAGAWLSAILANGYDARFGGDATYLPSSDHAGVVE